MSTDRTPRSTPEPADTPDERPIPLDIAETRGNPDVDEEIMGFQTIEGPGAGTDTDLGIPGNASGQQADGMPVPRNQPDADRPGTGTRVTGKRNADS